MDQLLHPEAYAALKLPDQWIEDCMQEYEAAYIVEQTKDCRSVLDLGWGSGLVAHALFNADRGVEVVDGSTEFCQQAWNAGMIAHHSMFEDFQPIGRYDTVIASFILEHVADPVKLLMRARNWADRIIVVVGNANSYHRQLAVKMGLQERLDTLSDRDRLVGHYRVYSLTTIINDLAKSGWMVTRKHGIQFKPLPNSMMTDFDPKLIRAMCEIDVPVECAANLILEARKICRA